MHSPHSLARCGNYARPFRSVSVNVYQNDDPIDKPRMIHQQTSYDSVVLIKHTGDIRGVPIDGDKLKVEKKMNKLI